jgi:hypothetical protein
MPVSSDDLSASDNDDDSVNFYPDEYDMAFNTQGHIGPMVCEMPVRNAVSTLIALDTPGHTRTRKVGQGAPVLSQGSAWAI